MNQQQFLDRLFQRAKEAGFAACEAAVAAAESFSAEVFKGEIIQYDVADSFGLTFRGLLGEKMGIASTQVLDDDAIDQLVEGAYANASLIEMEDRAFLWPGSDHYETVVTSDPALEDVTAKQKLEMARELERLTLAADPRIEQVEGCTIVTERSELRLVNTLGLDVQQVRAGIGGYVAPVARDGEKVNTGFGFFFTIHPDEIDLAAVAREAAQRALDGLDARPIPTAEMPVVFDPDAARSMLGAFSGIFSAENAQKGYSLLKGREGEVIAAECVTLRDDPHMPDSIASSPFDGEGVATTPKNIIDGGRLTTLMHNLRTAHRQGVETTGNAAPGGVSVAPTNFYIVPSDQPQEALFARCGNGLLVTDVSGLHAGANPISGDFSLLAEGFRIVNGQKGDAVKQITVAGNFYRLLQDIEAVGSDLMFGLPSAARLGSPSILVRSLSVAGEAKQ